MKAQTESAPLRAVLEYLALWPSVVAWRQNTGAARYGGRYVRFGPRGTPDVLGVLAVPSSLGHGRGRLLGIEVKGPRGRLRPEQRAWAENARAAGALVLAVRGLDDLRAQLRGAGYDAP